MTEKEKLIEAASVLGFDNVDEKPTIMGLPDDHTTQIWVKEQIGGGSKLFLGKPSKVQCAAMRSVLYFWKVLRLVEVAVTEDKELDSYVHLRFYKVNVDVKLPDTLSGGVVTPVRVVSNLILGQLNDYAIQTRGRMTNETEEVTQVKKIILPPEDLT